MRYFPALHLLVPTSTLYLLDYFAVHSSGKTDS